MSETRQENRRTEMAIFEEKGLRIDGMAAFTDGWKARGRDQDPSANPFGDASAEAINWMAGWKARDQHKALSGFVSTRAQIAAVEADLREMAEAIQEGKDGLGLETMAGDLEEVKRDFKALQDQVAKICGIVETKAEEVDWLMNANTDHRNRLGSLEAHKWYGKEAREQLRRVDDALGRHSQGIRDLEKRVDEISEPKGKAGALADVPGAVVASRIIQEKTDLAQMGKRLDAVWIPKKEYEALWDWVGPLDYPAPEGHNQYCGVQVFETINGPMRFAWSVEGVP